MNTTQFAPCPPTTTVLPSGTPGTGRALASNRVLIQVPHNFIWIPKASCLKGLPRYTSMFHCPLDIFTQCLTNTHLVISLRTKLMILSPGLFPVLLKGTNRYLPKCSSGPPGQNFPPHILLSLRVPLILTFCFSTFCTSLPPKPK